MTSRDVSQEHVLSIQEPKHSLLGQSILKRTSINIEDVYQIPPDSGIKWYGQEFDQDIQLHNTFRLNRPDVQPSARGGWGDPTDQLQK